MTVTTMTPAAPFGAITAHRVVTAIASVIEMVRSWNETRRTIAILRSLNADQLEDIGLTRDDVANFGR
jgi:uncharacterized protein YjiS (DUF1127 family)